MSKRNGEYWKKRTLQLEEALHRKGIEYYHDLEKLYTRAANETSKEILRLYTRLANENNISLSEAKKMLTGSELKEFRWNVEQYIKYGKENAVNAQWMKELENASLRYRISRLEAMRIEMQQQVEVLMGNELDGFSKVMTDIYTEGYYRNAHLIQTGLGVGHSFAVLDNNKIEKVLSKPWVGNKNFSQRIWGDHRTTLINDLHTHLTQSIIRGEAPDRAIKFIAQKYDVAKHRAGNLVMTESAYFGTKAQQDCYKELGVELQEFVATLDHRTSDICQEMDGKVFKTSELEIGVNAPPLHGRCRSVLVPYFEDSITERAARDEEGKTVYIDGNMKYADWKKKFVDGDTVSDVASDVVTAVKVFKPAESLDEVKQRFTTALGNDTIDLKKMDLNLANEYLEGVERFTQEYPMIKGFIKDVNTKTASPRTLANIHLAWSDKNNLVKITESKLCLRNPKNYADLLAKMQKDVESGFHYKGSSFKATAAHELTHGLEFMVGAISKGSYVDGKFIEIAAERPFETFSYQIVEQAKKDLFGKTVGREVYDGTKYLGKYSMTNSQEMLAECISYELTVGTNPFSAKVKELFDKKIAEIVK